MSEHLSEHVLERKALGLLDGDRARNAEAHLSGCDACRAKLTAMEKEQTDFAASKDANLFARRVLARVENAKPASPKFRWSWIAGLLAPAMAVAVLLLVRPTKPNDDYLGVKGNVHMELLTPQGKLADGAVVHPGDALRFSVSAPKAGSLLILSLNERGEVFAYYPLQGAESSPLGAGAGQVLPGSVVLDSTLGHERFYMLFTERPVAVADVESAVHAAHTTWKDAELPVHGDQASVLTEKVTK
ncbi:MAG: hypothetical protein JST54_25145 [Deltaproteobacteria bacterium]|nr:hypothetical protein [Deltaproteobacteria bacterium]